jgi:hypothetical protein
MHPTGLQLPAISGDDMRLVHDALPGLAGARLAGAGPAGDDSAGYSRAFAAALLNPVVPEPDCVAGPGGNRAGARFDVYRNNVTVSLIDALADTYPAVQRIVGRDFFRGMARIFVRACPPSSPLLFQYGRDLPGFIDNFEHARQMPWLGDVARVERAWLDAYHAADAAPLAAEKLSALAPAELIQTRFRVHPATRIVRSEYPAVTIFAANRNEADSGAVEASDAEDALITRPQLEIMVRWLPPGGAQFLLRLIDGATLGEAAEAAAQTEGFDLAANLEGMLSSGAFADIVA